MFELYRGFQSMGVGLEWALEWGLEWVLEWAQALTSAMSGECEVSIFFAYIVYTLTSIIVVGYRSFAHGIPVLLRRA